MGGGSQWLLFMGGFLVELFVGLEVLLWLGVLMCL